MIDFWEKYKKDLQDGYYVIKDGKKCLKAKFIVEYPKELVWILKNKKENKENQNNKQDKKKNNSQSNKNNTSQLRKFYDYVKILQNNIKLNDATFDSIYARLLELNPYVYYAFTRDTVTREFVDFIELNLEEINNLDDLTAFAKHFQALIAYLPKENQR